MLTDNAAYIFDLNLSEWSSVELRQDLNRASKDREEDRLASQLKRLFFGEGEGVDGVQS